MTRINQNLSGIVDILDHLSNDVLSGGTGLASKDKNLLYVSSSLSSVVSGSVIAFNGMKLKMGETAFSTINGAISHISGKCTVMVDYGTYEQDVVANCSVNDIILVGIGLPVISGKVKFQGMSNHFAVMKNFRVITEIPDTLTKTYAIQFNGACSKAVIENVQVSMKASQAYDTAGSSRITDLGVALGFTSLQDPSDRNGIVNAKDVLITNCKINGSVYTGGGVVKYRPSVVFQNRADGISFDNNIIHGCMYFNGGVENMLFQQNTIVSNDDNVFVFGTSILGDVKIVGNQIYSDSREGIGNVITFESDATNSGLLKLGKRFPIQFNSMGTFLFTCNDVTFQDSILKIGSDATGVNAQKFIIKGNSILSNELSSYFDISQGLQVSGTFRITDSIFSNTNGGSGVSQLSSMLSGYSTCINAVNDNTFNITGIQNDIISLAIRQSQVYTKDQVDIAISSAIVSAQLSPIQDLSSNQTIVELRNDIIELNSQITGLQLQLDEANAVITSFQQAFVNLSTQMVTLCEQVTQIN